MSQYPSLRFIFPANFTQEHYDALMAYLIDSRNLDTAVWRQVYKGIDLLDEAQVITLNGAQTFREAYDELIGQPFANQYIEQLLNTSDVVAESPKITAGFAR